MKMRPENQPPRPEERFVKLAEKKHPTVAAAVLLEQHLRMNDRMTDEEFIEFMENKDLPTSVRERMVEAIQIYQSEIDFADMQEGAILRAADKPVDQDVNILEFGGVVFSAATGKRQVGEVSVRRNGPFFIAVCKERQDYEHLCHNSPLSLWAKKPSADSIAQFHSSMTMLFFRKFKEIIVPMLVLQDLGDPQDLERSIDHEMQHYINAVILQDFSLTEVDHRWSEGEAERGVKDEILAYVRIGDKNIAGHIDQGLSYQRYLQSSLGGKEPKIKMVRRLDQALSNLPDVFHTPEGRAFLVYYLSDAPVEGFATLIQGLEEYSHELLQPFKRFELPRPELPTQDAAWYQYQDRYQELKVDCLLNPQNNAQYYQQQLEQAFADYQAAAIPRQQVS